MRIINKLQGIIILLVLFGAIIFVLCPYFPHIKYLRGRCIEVIDGDTIKLQTNKRVYRIRLNYIDAPEIDQLSFDKKAIGNLSKNFLEVLVKDKEIQVQYSQLGFYQRILGTLFIDDIEINRLMIKEGFAVLYPYAMFESHGQKMDYLYLYYNAKAKRKGMWNSSGFLDPKEYRKRKKLIVLD